MGRLHLNKKLNRLGNSFLQVEKYEGESGDILAVRVDGRKFVVRVVLCFELQVKHSHLATTAISTEQVLQSRTVQCG